MGCLVFLVLLIFLLVVVIRLSVAALRIGAVILIIYLLYKFFKKD